MEKKNSEQVDTKGCGEEIEMEMSKVSMFFLCRGRPDNGTGEAQVRGRELL